MGKRAKLDTKGITQGRKPDSDTHYEVSNNVVIVVAVLDMRRNPAWIHSQLGEREK